jgi:hypothetical protein
MDFNFFENDIFYQILNINLHKIIWMSFLKIKEFFEEFFKNIPRKFP